MGVHLYYTEAGIIILKRDLLFLSCCGSPMNLYIPDWSRQQLMA